MDFTSELSFGENLDAQFVKDSVREFESCWGDSLNLQTLLDVNASWLFPQFSFAEWNQADDRTAARIKSQSQEILELDRRWTVECLPRKKGNLPQDALGFNLLPCTFTVEAEIWSSGLEYQVRIQRIGFGNIEDSSTNVTKQSWFCTFWSLIVCDWTD